jgi:hypothetical protein
LFDEAYDIFDSHTDEAIEEAMNDFDERLTKSVTAHPILARTIHKSRHQWSLLHVVCEKTLVSCPESILRLIQTNPHALLWTRRSDDGEQAPIHILPQHDYLCRCFLWRLQHYPWVFQHEVCQTNPPHLAMMQCFGDGSVDPKIVQKFYTLYLTNSGSAQIAHPKRIFKTVSETERKLVFKRQDAIE